MIQSIRGMHDITIERHKIYEYILKNIDPIAKQFGFSYIKTPILEYSQLFKRSLGDITDIVQKEMYTFLDRNNESLTLRPEGTASVMRHVLEHKLQNYLPLKIMYEGPMFRYERPQKGRYRMFYQWSLEYLGSDSFWSDFELIHIGHLISKKFDISNSLHLNTIGDIESRNAYKEHLLNYLNKFKNDLSEESKLRFEKNPLRIFDSKSENDQKIMMDAPKLFDFLNDDSKRFFDNILNKLNEFAIPYILDKSLVRGLDYYSHTVFEFKAHNLGAQSTYLAGGRYDKLSHYLGGPDIPSVGFSMGLDRLMLLVEHLKMNDPLKIAVLPHGIDDQNESYNICDMLRASHFLTHFVPDPIALKKRFKIITQRLNADIAIIIGDMEREMKKVKVKFLKNVEEDTKEYDVDVSKLCDFLKNYKKN